MAEQDPKLASEIARFNAEAMKLEAEAEEINKRVGQKWYQGRKAVLLIIQSLIAGIIGAGFFAFFLYDSFVKKAEVDRLDVKIALGENRLQGVKLKEQETKLNDLKTKLKKQKGKLETQEGALQKQEAKLKDQEKKLNEQRALNDILKEALKAQKIQLAERKAGAEKIEAEARKTLSEKDLKSLERLERKTEELALKAVSPPRAMRVEKLRSKPETLNSKAIFKMVLDKGFSLPGHKIKGSFRHKYEAKTLSGDQVVEDHATGLMWQQGGSAGRMTFEEAKKYVADINARKLAGFDNWRLPTIEELISLVEPKLKDWSWTLFLDKNFDETQRWIRSADQRGPNNSWGIVFYEGKLYLPTLNFPYYVRLVRSSKSS